MKLGLMKQFVKALANQGEYFTYLSEAKLKEGVFVGPDIRKLMIMKDEVFESKMEEIEGLQIF
jgi:hypothetical protein